MIPSQNCGVTVNYYVIVQDLGGNWVKSAIYSYTVSEGTESPDTTINTSTTLPTSTEGVIAPSLIIILFSLIIVVKKKNKMFRI